VISYYINIAFCGNTLVQQKKVDMPIVISCYIFRGADLLQPKVGCGIAYCNRKNNTGIQLHDSNHSYKMFIHIFIHIIVHGANIHQLKHKYSLRSEISVGDLV
jgi:hypothetical protein